MVGRRSPESPLISRLTFGIERPKVVLLVRVIGVAKGIE
jgi:hypothetical protein